MISRRSKRLDDEQQIRNIAELFKTISDTTRLRLLVQLNLGDACVHELCAALDMSQTAVSHQLRILRVGRLVQSQRKGREIFYSIKDEHVMSLVSAALAHVSEIA